MIPKDFTIGEIRWFEGLRKKYSSIDLDYWDSTKLKLLLRNHYRIYYEYFSIPDHVKNQIDKHMNDLKSHVVQPLTGLLRGMSTFDYLVNLSVENITSFSGLGLYDDLINNHYPEVDKKVHSIKELTCKIILQGKSLNSQINNLLIEYLEDYSIRYEYEHVRINKNSIPIERFMERLWRLIETYSYNDDEFKIDRGYPETPRIIFGTLGLGIMYECQHGEDCEEILKKLQDICKKIISTIGDQLSEYNKIRNDRHLVINSLLDILDLIEFAYKLPFTNIDRLKCRYIDF